jgi:diacylglycerol kinase family enzyme
MRVWRRYRPLRVEVRASKFAVRSNFELPPSTFAVRTPFVFVGNNEYQLSGLELGGRKVLHAGRLHVCMAPGMSRSGVARLIIEAIFGDVCNLDGFDSFTAAAVTLDTGSARLQASLDGEVVTLDTPLTFRIRPGALRVVVP